MMKLALAALAVTAACHDHPCAPTQQQIDVGDPLDGYCAAVSVETDVPHDEVVALIGRHELAVPAAIAMPAHPEPPASFVVFELAASPHGSDGVLEAWSPDIDEGFRSSPVVGLARANGGTVVARGGSHLDDLHPDGDPDYYDATVHADADGPVELWGTITTFDGATPCARYARPNGTVVFLVGPNDWDCDGVPNASDTAPTDYAH